jgi:hypothetical protein
MRLIPVLLMIASGPALADGAIPAELTSTAPECYCTDRDHNRVELGQVICLQVNGRMFTARCEMSLNNPMWREVNEGCAISVFIGRTALPVSSG